MRVDEQTGKAGGKSRVTDYLKNEVAERMFERFEVGSPRAISYWSHDHVCEIDIIVIMFRLIMNEPTFIGPAQTTRLGPRPFLVLGPPDETHRFPRNHAKDQDDGS
jgi:hypothetical protein